MQKKAMKLWKCSGNAQLSQQNGLHRALLDIPDIIRYGRYVCHMARYIYRKPFLTYIYLDISAYRDIEIPIPMLSDFEPDTGTYQNSTYSTVPQQGGWLVANCDSHLHIKTHAPPPTTLQTLARVPV